MKRFLGKSIVQLNNLNGKVAIYKITCPSGKKFIGDTKDFPVSMQNHQMPYSKDSLVKISVEKYGWNAMDIQALGICEQEDAYDNKKRFIEKYNTLQPYGMNTPHDLKHDNFKNYVFKEQISQNEKISNNLNLTKHQIDDIRNKYWQGISAKSLVKEYNLKEENNVINIIYNKLYLRDEKRYV